MFHHQAQLLIAGQTFSGNVISPKAVTNMLHWYKACMRAIPMVPELFSEVELNTFGRVGEQWFWATDPSVTENWIKFDLQSTRANKAQLVIKRR